MAAGEMKSLFVPACQCSLCLLAIVHCLHGHIAQVGVINSNRSNDHMGTAAGGILESSLDVVGKQALSNGKD